MLPIRRNALYHVVKRGLPLRDLAPGARAAIGATLLTLPVHAAWAVCGAFAQGLVGRGATITVQAQRG